MDKESLINTLSTPYKQDIHNKLSYHIGWTEERINELNTVQDNGTCPRDGSKLDIEATRQQKHIKLELYCPKCNYYASCLLPWTEYQEGTTDD